MTFESALSKERNDMMREIRDQVRSEASNIGIEIVDVRILRTDLMDEVLKNIEAHLNDAQPPTYYIASLVVDSCLPGFRAENDLDFASHGIEPPPVIWIGNRTTASAHYDAPNNIACVNRRRRHSACSIGTVSQT